MGQSEFSSQDREYLDWLSRAERKSWRRFIDVQLPYRWNLRRLRPGRVLDVGAGIGRNLEHLEAESVGIEMNRAALEVLRKKGLRAHHPDEFLHSPDNEAGAFDTILFSHVAEHMSLQDFTSCVRGYFGSLRGGGRLIVICPQEKGFASDDTHVEFMDHDKIAQAVEPLGFVEERRFSFPFPRWFGRHFRYNEFVTVFRKRNDEVSAPSGRRQ